MREILFRGKRIDNGEWVYGFYCSGYERHYISPEIFLMEREISNEYEVENEGEEPIFTDGLKLGMFNLVKPETVSQFTGLRDKNGKKIFEGDILKESRLNGLEFYYKVFYKKGGLVINTHQDDFNKPTENILFYESIADMQNSGFIETLEIIGNIHDSNDKN